MAHPAIRRRTPARRRPGPRWHRRKDARPEEIVAAALEEFVERGFAATRVEDVARRAGVTKGTVYLYFKNKDALFKAVVRENIVPVIAEAEATVRAFHGSARELLQQLVRTFWRVIYETKLAGIPKLMMAEAANFPALARFYYDEVVTRSHGLVRNVLEAGMRSGEFRRIDVAVGAKLAMSPLMHAAVAQRAFASCIKEGFDVRRYLDTHIDLYLHGIANP